MNGLMYRTRKFLDYYRYASLNRRSWLSIKWRLFVVLLLMSFMLVVQEYLRFKYVAEIAASPESFLVAEFILSKVFYWFFVGIMAGALAAWLIFEGEYAIGVYKMAQKMEHSVIQRLQRATHLPVPEKKHAQKKKKR